MGPRLKTPGVELTEEENTQWMAKMRAFFLTKCKRYVGGAGGKEKVTSFEIQKPRTATALWAMDFEDAWEGGTGKKRARGKRREEWGGRDEGLLRQVQGKMERRGQEGETIQGGRGVLDGMKA